MTPPSAPDAGLREDEREWQALAEKAKPSPWVKDPFGTLLSKGIPWEQVANVYDQEDEAFIAAARTAVPELLKRIEMLRAELPQLKTGKPESLH